MDSPPESDIWILDDGTLISRVHSKLRCHGRNCTIHNPSDHPLKNATLTWDTSYRPGHALRICLHDLAHPDWDDIRWRYTAGLTVPLEHHCCFARCCAITAETFKGLERPDMFEIWDFLFDDGDGTQTLGNVDG